MKIKIDGVENLQSDKPMLMEHEGEKYLIYKLSDGLFATSHKCTHLFKSLEKGVIVSDKTIRCPLHRAEFDIRTGEVDQWACFPPGVQLINGIRPEKSLDSYKVIQEGEEYFMEL